MAAKDTWDWTTDELVARLCYSGELFSQAGYQNFIYPQADILAAQLVDRRVTGKLFLAHINDDTLREEFGIQMVGLRQVLLDVIRALRSRSIGYKQPLNPIHKYGVQDPDFAERDHPHSGRSNDALRAHASRQQNREKSRAVQVITVPLPATKSNAQPTLADPTLLHDRERGFLGRGSTETVNEEVDYGWLKHWEMNETAREYENDQSEQLSLEYEHDEEEDEEVPEEEDMEEEEPGDADAMEQEAPSGAQGKRRYLEKYQVIEIINEFIEEYTEKWHPGKHADEEFDQAWDPHELWHEFRAQDDTEKARILEETNMRIEDFGARVDNLCNGIIESEWASRRSVRRQCANIERTIDLLEQEKWELSVYELENEPPKLDLGLTNKLVAKSIVNQSVAGVYGQSNFDDVIIIDEDDSNVAYTQARSKAIPSTQAPVTLESNIIDLGSDSETSETNEQDRMQVDEESQPSEREDQDSSEHVSPSNGPSQPMIIDTIENSPRLSFREQSHTLSLQDTSPIQQAPSTPIIPLPSTQTRQPPPMTLPSPKPLSSVHPSDRPEDASITTILKWNWPDLTTKKDRKRIILKILSEMVPADLENVRARVYIVRKPNLLLEIPACVDMLVRRDGRIPGYLPRDIEKIVAFTKLWLSWWLADDYFNSRKDVDKERLEECSRCLNVGSRDPGIFLDWLGYVLRSTFSDEALQSPGKPSQAEIIVISDDEDGGGFAASRSSQRRGRGR